MTHIPAALKRVLVREDPAQDEAAVQHIDRSNGADVVTLTVNPGLVDDQALDGYKVRAALTSALEGFVRYNRRVRQQFGTYDGDQLLFDTSYEQASQELDELVHLAPRAQPTPAQAKKLVQAWLEDPALSAALTPLLGGDDGQPDPDAEPPAAGTARGKSAESGGKRPRR